MKKVIFGVLVLGLFAANSLLWAGNSKANEKVVRAFYELAFNKHQPEEAVRKYVGPKYIQHNPVVKDGSQAFVDFFVPYFKEYAESSAEIMRAVVQGDLVVLHVHSKRNKQDIGRAVIDIFRLEKGKIVEHWDVAQDLPGKAANSNTMF